MQDTLTCAKDIDGFGSMSPLHVRCQVIVEALRVLSLTSCGITFKSSCLYFKDADEDLLDLKPVALSAELCMALGAWPAWTPY